MYNDRFAEWRGRTSYLVESTDAEQLWHWQRFAEEAPRHDPELKAVRWCDLGSVMVTIGHLRVVKVQANVKHAVCVTLTFARLNDIVVCFWEPTSQVIAYDMIEAWLDEMFPHHPYRTNAMNFASVIGLITKE